MLAIDEVDMTFSAIDGGRPKLRGPIFDEGVCNASDDGDAQILIDAVIAYFENQSALRLSRVGADWERAVSDQIGDRRIEIVEASERLPTDVAAPEDMVRLRLGDYELTVRLVERRGWVTCYGGPLTQRNGETPPTPNISGQV